MVTSLWKTWIWRDDCGMAHVTPDELSLVYSLVSDSSLSMAVQGTEQPGLFLTAALLSQTCLQNTRWWEILNELSINSSTIFFCRCVYKGRDNKLFLYAATNIKKGEKLCHSWTKNLLFTPTNERQKMLRDVFINCQCLRCLDSSEMGTNLRWVHITLKCIILLWVCWCLLLSLQWDQLPEMRGNSSTFAASRHQPGMELWWMSVSVFWTLHRHSSDGVKRSFYVKNINKIPINEGYKRKTRHRQTQMTILQSLEVITFLYWKRRWSISLLLKHQATQA